jgi:hypothetical protein
MPEWEPIYLSPITNTPARKPPQFADAVSESLRSTVAQRRMTGIPARINAIFSAHFTHSLNTKYLHYKA